MPRKDTAKHTNCINNSISVATVATEAFCQSEYGLYL